MVADVVDYNRLQRVYGSRDTATATIVDPGVFKKSSPMTKACVMIIFLMVLYLIKRNRDHRTSTTTSTPHQQLSI